MVTKEKILDSLYGHCQVRSHTTKDVVTKILTDLNETARESVIEQLIEVVRPYKNSSKDLEKTVNSVYEILNNRNSFTFGFEEPLTIEYQPIQTFRDLDKLLDEVWSKLYELASIKK